MKVSAVTVCVNFGDYFSVTSPLNRNLFHKWVVVTDPKDELTKEVATKNNCIICLSDSYSRDQGDSFNKGKMINNGLDLLGSSDWTCLVDADVVLPESLHFDLRSAVGSLRLRKPVSSHPANRYTTLFGAQRLMCHSEKEWAEYKKTKAHSWAIERERHTGHVPPGFLQLWSRNYVRYPENCKTAEISDILFGKNFKHRCYIDTPVIHLEAGGTLSHRRDHKGRLTRKWKV